MTTINQSSDHTPFAILVAFILTMLGFFVYHFSLRQGFITPFLGGYSAIIGILLAPLAIIVYARRALSLRHFCNHADMLFFAFILMIGSVAGVNYLYGNVIEISEAHLAILPSFVGFFIIFKFISFRDKPTLTAGAISLIIMTMVMLSISLPGDPLGIHEDLSPASIDLEDIADYQQYALLYYIILVYCSAVSQQIKLRLIIYSVGCVTLFYNGARSEFIVWFLAMMTIEVFHSHRRLYFILLGSIPMFFISGALSSIMESLFPNNRFILLLENLTQDQSFVERQYLLDHALNIINNNIITGSYGYYMKGMYAHNILSVWADFGFFGFVLFSICLIMPLIGSLESYRARLIEPETVALACFALTSVVFFLFAKAYTHQILPVTLALYSRYVYSKRATSRRQGVDRDDLHLRTGRDLFPPQKGSTISRPFMGS